MYRDPQPYVTKFATKHELAFNHWLNDSVCIFDHYWFISFDDILTDLELNAPKHEILKYYESESDLSFIEWINSLP